MPLSRGKLSGVLPALRFAGVVMFRKLLGACVGLWRSGSRFQPALRQRLNRCDRMRRSYESVEERWSLRNRFLFVVLVSSSLWVSVALGVLLIF